MQWDNFTPRWYQREGVDSVYEYLNANTKGNPLIALPTGTGKSWMPAMIMHELLSQHPWMKIACITHVQELIQQDLDKVLELWPLAPVGVYSAGMKRKEAGHPLTFGGVQSMVHNIAAFGKVHLLIIDEAHLISPKATTMYQRLITGLKVINPRLRVVGLTATYYRMGDGLLTDEGQIFTDLSYNQCTIGGFNRFLDEGFLMPLVPKKTNVEYDLEGVGSSMGDYKQNALDERVNENEASTRVCDDIFANAMDRKHWLTFCTSIDHAERMAEMMTARGMPTKALHSKLNTRERAETLRDFRSGVLKSVTNKDMLTTGHDFPFLDLINMCRPTQSASRWVQMLGRGTRPFFLPGTDIHTMEGRLAGIARSPKKDCMVRDYAGNTGRLGPINDPVIPIRIGKKKVKREAPVKVCEQCMTYCHAAVRVCQCGFEFKFISGEDRLESTASSDELIRRDDMPITERFPVERVTYSRNKRAAKDANMKVTYHCGLRTFNKWIFFANSKPYLRAAAYRWWEECAHESSLVPSTLEEAISRAKDGELMVPDSIVVWLNDKSGYPQIMSHDFTTRKRATVADISSILGSDGLLQVLP